MAFPDSVEALTLCGYRFQRSTECKGCQAPIDWWVTPNNKKIPLDAGTAKPHWATCTKADQFRKLGKKKEA